MDPDNPKASELERRWSLQQTRSVSVDNAATGDNVAQPRLSFSGIAVADGFRPRSRERPTRSTSIHGQETTTQSSESPQPRRSVHLEHRLSIAKAGPVRRISTSAQHGVPVSFDAPLSRISSVSTDTPMSSNRDSYHGPSGPSHPYQMYQQNVRLARTLSNSTATTTPRLTSASPYTGPTVPSHAYMAYPEPSTLGHGTVPMGPGHYQRRIGPDGEEAADMIGPDGHTEALPPYTRYPDEAYVREIRDHATGESGQGRDSTSLPHNPLAIPGAGGIGLAARNPEFDSPDDESPTMRSRQSLRSLDASESHHDINTAARYSEKPVLNKWQRIGRRRVWGIVPCWAIALAVLTIIMAVIIVSAVVKTLLNRRNAHPDVSNVSSPTVTLTVDAVPVSTPTGSLALPTGTFGLPGLYNMAYVQAPNMCFNDTMQTQAWSCSVVAGFAVRVSLSANAPHADGTPSYDITIGTNESYTLADNWLAYGSQPPIIDTSTHLDLVTDTFDPLRGQAWFSMVSYNKTVLIPEDHFNSATSDTSVRRRAGPYFRALPGDRPWMCTWPNTFIEVFIYASQNSSYTSPQSSATTTSTPTATATSSYLYGTVTSVSQASSTSTSTTVMAMPTPQMQLAPNYPRAVKIKERRFNSPKSQAFCAQVEVQPDNSTRPVLDAKYNPVIVYISETEPGPLVDAHRKRATAWAESTFDAEAELDERGHGDAQVLRRSSVSTKHWQNDDVDSSTSQDMSSCGCMWFNS